MSETLTISGALTAKDIKRLTQLTRASTVGPTATYYAGVTAPIISAAVALFTKSAFQSAGVSDYWTFFGSTLMAAMAGIVWYLIFMRWSYRHTFGRGSELSEPTQVLADPAGVELRRGPITTRIAWPAVEAVHLRTGYTAISARGADAIIIPDRWFDGDKTARQAFAEFLTARGDG